MLTYYYQVNYLSLIHLNNYLPTTAFSQIYVFIKYKF